MIRIPEIHAISVFGCTAALAMCAPSHHARAATLYAFKGGTDAENPNTALIRDKAGNLYGATYSGGKNGDGAIFKITSRGAETLIYSFKGHAGGANPIGGLILDSAGNLYGTTSDGGSASCNCGVVFKLTPNGAETILHTFKGGRDGASPQAELIGGSNGNLYGTTNSGGPKNSGTVFMLTPAGVETVLYAFKGKADGGNPDAGLILDSAGNLYGTSFNGGAHIGGTVFKLTPSGAESVLHGFCSKPACADGDLPGGTLLMDANGNLFGTTLAGGKHAAGTVFEVTPEGVETVLFSFTGKTDGGSPFGALINDSAGNLYGTTQQGGASNHGTVFSLTPANAETVVHAFSGKTDGAGPIAGLVSDNTGHVYGTAQQGGAHDSGVVFKLLE